MWELWPNESDRIEALKSGNNMRPKHPFMLAWDRAFTEVFGGTEPRARLLRGRLSGCKSCWNIFVHINTTSPSVDRPNGWWTTELPKLEVHTSTQARKHARTHARRHLGT